MKISEFLETFDAKNVKLTRHVGFKQDEGGEKSRYMFTIEDQKNALECFSRITKEKGLILDGRIQLRIFYVKPGKIFSFEFWRVSRQNN